MRSALLAACTLSPDYSAIFSAAACTLVTTFAGKGIYPRSVIDYVKRFFIGYKSIFKYGAIENSATSI